MDVEDDAERVFEHVALRLGTGREQHADLLRRDREILDEGVADLLLLERHGQPVRGHLHRQRPRLALNAVARHLRELEDDRGDPLLVDHVGDDRQLAGAAAGDEQAGGLGPPIERVALEIAPGLSQEVGGNQDSALAAHRRLGEGDDGLSDRDDGAADPEHHLGLVDGEAEPLARIVLGDLAAEAAGERLQAEEGSGRGDRDRHGEALAVEGDGRQALAAAGTRR